MRNDTGQRKKIYKNYNYEKFNKNFSKSFRGFISWRG